VGGQEVVLMNKVIWAGTAMAMLMGVACSDGDVPLLVRVPCEAVLALRLGDDWGTQVENVGKPPRHWQLTERTPISALDSQVYDEAAAYGTTDVERFRFRDTFDILLLEGRVVHAFAARRYSGSPSPDGTNPRYAFYLRRGPDGVELREIGPAFNDVFGCDPPVIIPASK
jgi:hypothetical protein